MTDLSAARRRRLAFALLGTALGAFSGALPPGAADADPLLPNAAPASPQVPKCAARARVAELLESRYGETHRASEIRSPRAVVELFGNARSGTWTLLLTDVRGRSCVLAVGRGFRGGREGHDT